jgi:hypothetical protein
MCGGTDPILRPRAQFFSAHSSREAKDDALLKSCQQGTNKTPSVAFVLM